MPSYYIDIIATYRYEVKKNDAHAHKTYHHIGSGQASTRARIGACRDKKF